MADIKDDVRRMQAKGNYGDGRLHALFVFVADSQGSGRMDKG
jgi:hypothetical protein